MRPGGLPLGDTFAEGLRPRQGAPGFLEPPWPGACLQRAGGELGSQNPERSRAEPACRRRVCAGARCGGNRGD